MCRQKIYPVITLFCCCLLFGCAIGLLGNCIGLFITPISQSLGITIGSLSIFVTLQNLSTAFCNLLYPFFMKRFKIQHLIRYGVLRCSGNLLLMSCYHSYAGFYLSGIIAGTGIVCFSNVTCVSILQNWFKRNNGLVVSLAMAFSGIMGAIMNPVLGRIIVSFGWRSGFRCAAVLLLVMTLPCSFFLRSTPGEYGVFPVGEAGASIAQDDGGRGKMPKLALVLLVICVVCFHAPVGLNSHLSSFGMSLGMTLTESANLVMIAMLANVVFKIVLGWLSDRLGIFKAVIITCCITLVGLLLWLTVPASSNWFLLGAFLFGAAYGTGNVCLPLIIRVFVGNEGFSAFYSRIMLMISLSVAVFTSVIGLLYDYFQSYRPVLVMLGGAVMIGMLAVLWMGRVAKRRRWSDE